VCGGGGGGWGYDKQILAKSSYTANP